MALDLHLSYAPGVARRGVPARTSFTAWVDAALSVARRRRAAELSIRLVDADEGRALNRQYRGRDYATNVLSFPAELPPGVVLPLLGDLVICVPVVAREAAEQNKPVKHHYAHMTVHGVLHLIGHDHIEEADAERMEALERKALAGLGIADPYV
ncbi:rRNA maturation RNase YbeY [Tahibacter soli]|uniref:Endoribonuclease YbeY n=1 Tax=Tahibacter soli TaxID=2983605 RepID=A0A9X4BH56_9GAMM|nr:rRNA maturation RNase YbeY [Tahibacter soli]MDC8011953.1 rRNA maturation RNase YbeY [Tahibacter soli]